MRLAVISDTHLHDPTTWLRTVYERYLEPADALVHCGDLVGYPVLSFLELHRSFHGVAGNMCSWQIQSELPSMLTLELEGFRVGVTHGWGDRRTLARTVAEAFGPGYDLVLFGHSHSPEATPFGDTLAVNPGSLQRTTSGGSLAYVTLERGKRPVVDFVTVGPDL